MRILLVEDDAQLAQSTAARISREGYVVDHVGNGVEADEAIASIDYALVILDRRLPDGDAIRRIGEFRKHRPELRVIVLTAFDATPDKISGLEAGADDYLTKPFEIDELMARIRAVLRRPGAAAQPAIHCGNLSYDPSSREFLVSGEMIVLTRREQLILASLMLRARRVVQRHAFMNQVYGFDEDIQSNTLDAHISRLRTRLIQLKTGVQIKAVRGVGYFVTDQVGP